MVGNIHKNLCCEFLHLCLFLRPSSKVRTHFTGFGLGFSTKQNGNFVGTLVERTFCSWVYCGLSLLSFGIPPLFWKDVCSKQSLCKVFQRLNHSCDLLWMKILLWASGQEQLHKTFFFLSWGCSSFRFKESN